MSQRWLVTGASGQLGGHVLGQIAAQGPADVCALTGLRDLPTLPATVTLIARQVDLRDAEGLAAAVREFRPTHVVHTAALTVVADAFARPTDAIRMNTAATMALAEAADAVGARFVFTSTDMVFAGDAAPYDETAAPDSATHYGRSKIAAELALRRYPAQLTVRIPLLYGAPLTPRETTFTRQVAAMRAGETLHMFADEFRTPLHLADAARALVTLALSDAAGVLHLAGPERLSRLDMAQRFAAALGLTPRLEAISRRSITATEPRPADLSLRAERFRRQFPDVPLRPIAEALR